MFHNLFDWFAKRFRRPTGATKTVLGVEVKVAAVNDEWFSLFRAWDRAMFDADMRQVPERVAIRGSTPSDALTGSVSYGRGEAEGPGRTACHHELMRASPLARNPRTPDSDFRAVQTNSCSALFAGARPSNSRAARHASGSSSQLGSGRKRPGLGIQIAIIRRSACVRRRPSWSIPLRCRFRLAQERRPSM
jgi:hypothetical protein